MFEKRGIMLVLLVILIFSSSLVLAIQENIVYENDEDIDFYYGLAVFKNSEEVDRITHQFVTPAHFLTETSLLLYSYQLVPPVNALVGISEQWFENLRGGDNVRYISFKIDISKT